MTTSSIGRSLGKGGVGMLAVLALSCGGTSSPGTPSGSGGLSGSGGVTGGASGGSSGSGGNANASGGKTGSGGTTSSASGGISGSGGARTGGTTGTTGTGGAVSSSGGATVPGSGGSAPGTGGSSAGGSAAGGHVSAGGSSGHGGAAASGGSTGQAGGSGSMGAAVPSAGCGKTPTLWGADQGTAVMASWAPAGRYTQHTIGGRNYYLQVPSNYDNSHPYRLVVAYHWYTGAAIEVVDCHSEGINCYTTQSPFFGLWELANGSTIFVAPDGTPAPTVTPAASANNNGSPKVSSSSAGWGNSGGQDIKLTTDLLKALEADLCIDTSRIFANGFSYGGAMSYEVTCDPSTVGQFRGVAIYSGSPVLSGCSATGGKPSTPIAAFLSHGNMDPTNMFSWGQTMRDNLAADNGCKAPSSPLSSTVDNAAAGTHMCYSYDGCSAGHPVEWCVFGKQTGCTGGDHSPTPCDKGATKPWNPQQVWNFITQF